VVKTREININRKKRVNHKFCGIDRLDPFPKPA
jgi:hypothetical protein